MTGKQLKKWLEAQKRKAGQPQDQKSQVKPESRPILDSFLMKDWEILNPSDPDPCAPLWGHEFDTFRIGEYQIKLNVEELDEDYLILNEKSPMRITPRMKEADYNLIYKMVRYIASGSSSLPSFIFSGISSFKLPEKKYLGEVESVRASNPQEIFEKYQDLAKTETLPESSVYEDEYVRACYNPELHTIYYNLFDIEEGVGKKDNTVWVTNKNFICNVILWSADISFEGKKEVHPDFQKLIKEHLTPAPFEKGGIKIIQTHKA